MYPPDVLPPWLQTLAWLLPSTHVFEGMHTALRRRRPAASRSSILRVVPPFSLGRFGTHDKKGI
jgi:hypothetical protein